MDVIRRKLQRIRVKANRRKMSAMVVDTNQRNDTQIVNDLMHYSINNAEVSIQDQQFYECAVKSLIRRLRRSQEKGIVENLIRSVKHADQDTACVKIPRSLDGRMQVMQKKTIPHVIFYQIWRDKTVKSYHELQAIVTCRHAYDMSQTGGEICVNPFHYERRVRPQLNGIHQLVDRQSQDTCYSFDDSNQNMVYDNQATALPASNFQQTALVLHQGQMQYSNEGETSTNNGQAWLTVAYWEREIRLGEKFFGWQPDVFISGGYNPNTENGSKFCLGAIANPSRDDKTSSVRCHIGQGIKISGGPNCQVVYLDNLSDHAVFIQSQNWNIRAGQHKNKIIKVPSRGRAEVFNTSDFYERLFAAKIHGYNAVADLAHHCTMRLSFVKGWGVGYKVQEITSTPCWVELTLQHSLAWIDDFLKGLDPPGKKPSSFT
ncbi:Oidioi.mRNA.OKI2018_I69.XSR.g15846.t2.cds [Oikopleura dioica]|uniref:Mothers against decapentaplegic homolog n=1 Tax=Oikopleura dioica TaxID=34765 RepID=A0ABN7SKI4_OIKDI|nr:Oidioi.mRNA.OKI2018_I69.XSR.g15846.t2.cds [Oikopleura dioica]